VLAVNPGKVLFATGCCHKREKESGKKPINKIRKKPGLSKEKEENVVFKTRFPEDTGKIIGIFTLLFLN
jgi:hypothetical protein